MSEITYHEGTGNLTSEELIGLYDEVGWTAYTKKPEALFEAVSNSTFVIVARSEGRLVGLARSLSDHRAVNYIQDIIVLPSFQRRGIGTELVRRNLDHFPLARTHILLTDDDEYLHRFYESLAFKNTALLRKTRLHAFVRMDGIELE